LKFTFILKELMTPFYNFTISRIVFKIIRYPLFYAVIILYSLFNFQTYPLISFITLLALACSYIIIGFTNPRTSLVTINLTSNHAENGRIHARHADISFIYRIILFSYIFVNSWRKLSITVLEEYQQEIAAFVQEFNIIKNKTLYRFLPDITKQQVLYYHMLADSKCACTCIVVKDKNNNIIFGRNLDWCPFGKAGDNTVILEYPAFTSYGIPGLFGVITGTRNNLAIAMNVSPKDPVTKNSLTNEGAPACFFNRMVLENCNSVTEVNNFINFQTKRLSEYQLTVVDEKNYMRFFLGKSYIAHTVENPSFTLNFRFPNVGVNSFDSPGRLAYLNSKFHNYSNLSKEELIKLVTECLTSTQCNTFQTVQSFIFDMSDRIYMLRCNNTFSGECEPIIRAF
jgi:predicted choloylglycine hydrolase